ncbi:MAG: hypothetical protein AAB950_00050 [Patescibacteria group bacterium]
MEKEVMDVLLGHFDDGQSVVIVELEGDNDPIAVIPGQTVREMFSTLGVFPEQVRTVQFIGEFPDINWIPDADIRGSVAEAISRAFLNGILTERTANGGVVPSTGLFPSLTAS